jgi:hypothetical protein
MNRFFGFTLGLLAAPVFAVLWSGAALAQRDGVTEPMRQQCKAQVRGQKLRTRGKRQVAYLQCLADRINRLPQPPAARSP